MSSSADEVAFTAWARARQPALLRSAYLLTLDHARAEDLVQEVLVKVARRWARFRDDPPDAYARTILVHDNVSWWRKHRRERPIGVLPELVDTGGIDRSERAMLLHQALGTLTAKQRAVLVLRYYDDLTEAQTADALGVGVGTVKSQAHAALHRLRAEAPWLAELISEEASR